MVAQFPADVQAGIQERVDSGRYEDAAEVVREALAALEEREAQEEREQLERLRELLAVGVAQMERGEAEEYTPEMRARIRESARRRLAAGERPNPDVWP